MSELHRLADRFDDVDSPRSLEAAIRNGGMIVSELLEIGDIENQVLTELAKSAVTNDPNVKDFAFRFLWIEFAEREYQNAAEIAFRSIGNGCHAGETDPNDYKIRAANYAAVARKVGDRLLKEKGAGDPWILVHVDHYKPSRTTLYRFSKDEKNSGVRNADRKYYIRKSRIGDLVKGNHISKYIAE